MSPREWGHGQTFIGGAIAGLALAQRPLLIFAGGIVVGATLVLTFKFAGRALRWLADAWRIRQLRRNGIVSGVLPKRGSRSRA
jgi:hypothetical protein